MTPEEVNRQARVVDQMLSMHSALRDRYVRRATLLTLGILGCSVILCTVTFMPDDALNPLGVSASANRFVIGGFSGVVFFLSIVELCVSWAEVARRHGEASESLAKLKQQYRAAVSGREVECSACAKLTEEFGRVMAKLPRIPDKQFPSLKAYHLHKVCLSQMIDSHVGCPVWLLRLRLVWEGMFGKKDQEGRN